MALQVFTRGTQLDRERMKWSRNKPYVGYSRCSNTVPEWQSVGWLCQRIGALSCLLAASLFDTCWLGHLQIARKTFFFLVLLFHKFHVLCVGRGGSCVWMEPIDCFSLFRSVCVCFECIILHTINTAATHSWSGSTPAGILQMALQYRRPSLGGTGSP